MAFDSDDEDDGVCRGAVVGRTTQDIDRSHANMIGIPKTLRQEKHINRVLTKSHGAICSSAMAHSQNALVPLPRHSELPISSSCIKNVAAMLLERVAA